MGFYLDCASSVKERQTSIIYDIDAAKLYLVANKTRQYLFDIDASSLDGYQSIIQHALDARYDHFEISLLGTSIDDDLLLSLLGYLADILKDKDLSIGIIIPNYDFIRNHIRDIESLGIAHPRLAKNRKGPYIHAGRDYMGIDEERKKHK